MKIFQKTIATILIIGLVLSLGFNIFLFKPKQAQAVVDTIGGPSNILKAIKDLVLDTIGWTITDRVLDYLMNKITAWGMGQTSDTMQTFQVIDWKLFFAEAVNRGSARFIQEFDVAFDFVSGACEQGLKLKKALQNLGFGLYTSDLPRYSEYARPTLEDLGLEACQEFVSSGYSLIKGGWAGWFSLTMKPQNNIFSQVLMAERAQTAYQAAEKEAADKETAVSHGYQDEKTTNKTDVEACKDHCEETYGVATGPPSPEMQSCLARCDTKLGIPLETTVKNWGTTIEKQMTDALGKDMNRIIDADEITELIGVIFSALLNKAIDGMGLNPQATTPTSSQRNRAENKEYSYLASFLQEQTPEKTQSTRAKILDGVLKAIQQFNRSVVSCKEDEMLTDTRYAKNLMNIIDPNVKALYIGLTGTNLKPDFEVLDPVFAPYTLYGYSWGQVPANKIPPKCRGIIDQIPELKGDIYTTCRNIESGLEPASASYSLIEEKCGDCMYNHDGLTCPPDPVPPLPYQQWPSETVSKQKGEFYNSCRRQYNKTLNRCKNCLKKVDEKCNQDNKKQKEQCILNNCSSYANLEVVSPPIDGLDFYNKCLIEEAKTACYACLKEYFMPATYCGEINEYVARAIIKYPTVVLVEHIDDGASVGRYDEILGEEGGECNNDRNENKPIRVDLICRIMPDFEYDGQTVCRDCFNNKMTEEQLRDITDSRPNGPDCNEKDLLIGGRVNVWQIIKDGLIDTLGKCCANAWQGDATKYTICLGGQARTQECTWAKPVKQEPYCYCDEGWRPLSFTRTGLPRVGGKGGDCHDDSFSWQGLTELEVYGYTNNDPAGSMVYIASGGCTETDETCHNTTGVGLHDAPCTPSGVTDATGPSGVIWSANTPGSKTNNPRNPQKYTNIPNLGTGSHHVGVYHNNNSDGSTGWHFCAKCNTSDPDYYSGGPGYYGNELNQCYGKVD